MKKYFLDTNYCLRFILKDNEDQHNQVVRYFIKAKQGRLEIIVAPEVIIEAQYVLRKVYNTSSEWVGKALLKFVQMPFLTIVDEGIYQEALTLYWQLHVDIEDLILFLRAKQAKAEVLSFDKDMQRIKRVYSSVNHAYGRD